MRSILLVVAATFAVIAASCTPLPPSTGVGEKVEVFVVGDSWALLAGNPQVKAERKLPSGLGFVEPGANVLKQTLNAVKYPGGGGRFDVVAYHPWGISGSTAEAWQAGNPCEPITAATACPGIPVDRRGEITDTLVEQIQAVPADRAPLIYLSLGANDLILAGKSPANGGTNLDLGDPAATAAELAAIQTDLNNFIVRILTANSNSKVIIAGYHTLNTTGILCQAKWDARFPASAPLSQTALNTTFDTGLDSVYDWVVATNGTSVWFEANWYALSTYPNPAVSNLDLLCLHFVDNRPFVGEVVNDYVH